ncbi:cyclodeaminase/cyclohydrolase family protein [Candidatus Omnitrophota bacterium]
MYISGSIKRYVEDLAARKPAPGGGSAAAFSGALGVALLEMVCNFTLGNEKYKDLGVDMQTYLASLRKIEKEFCSLIDDDVKCYSVIRDAFKSKDKKVIDKALKDGYRTSLKTCKVSIEALKIAVLLPEKGNPNLITDVGCGAELLEASFNSGIFNAEINLKGLEDEDFIKKERALLEEIKKESTFLYKDAISKTQNKMR